MMSLGLWQGLKPIFRQAVKTRNQAAVYDVLQLKSQSAITELVRTTTFFNKLSSEEIWKSVTTVSNPGKRRGRAKSVMRKGKYNLNKGQHIGIGPKRMQWPGLNVPIIQSNYVVQIEKLPNDPNYKENLISQRTMTKRRKMALHPLERGWSGTSPLGRYIGPPPPIGDENFVGFDSVVLETRSYSKLSGLLGRIKSSSAVVATGNKNGILGVGKATCPELKDSIRKALRKASTKLNHFPLIDGHTVNHDFSYRFGNTKLFVSKKPKGYGLMCHRVIQELCKLIGISDLHAKVEGAINVKHIIKAFLLGLLQQKTYQQLADEKKLHLVEFREERDDIPVVLASPSTILTPDEKRRETVTDFYEHIHGNKVVLKKTPPPMENTPTYLKHMKKTYFRRNHDEVKMKLLKEYGEYRSFMSDVYPECKLQQKELPAAAKAQEAGT